MPRGRTPAIDRFWTHVSLVGACLIWTSSKNHKGYGLFRNDDQRQVPAHQWAYDHFYGDRAPGAHVLHLCDTPLCVNPKHLFQGTNQDNVDDKMAKGRHGGGRGETHGNSKLSYDDVRHIRSASDIVSGDMLAELYGVSAGTISQVRSRKRYADI